MVDSGIHLASLLAVSQRQTYCEALVYLRSTFYSCVFCLTIFLPQKCLFLTLFLTSAFSSPHNTLSPHLRTYFSYYIDSTLGLTVIAILYILLKHYLSILGSISTTRGQVVLIFPLYVLLDVLYDEWLVLCCFVSRQ